ncbi:MAG TPA: cell wall hydrolase [Sphingomicrobium sp.]|nr:cell wall hydrolase [Sphingomicrobium sp.]
MKKFWGGRALSAAAGLFLFVASNQAIAAPLQPASAGMVDAAAKPFGILAPAAKAAVSTLNSVASAAVSTVTGGVLQTRPATSVSVSLTQSVAIEAAWLQKNGWPLYALVDRYSTGAPLDDEANCIAVAVYHEARGESLEGQLAVARVIMNRASSGQYPTSWCGVVKQPWQFSFVHNGRFPSVDEGSVSWHNAVGVTRLAINNAVPSLSNDVLWYHANYVAPSWGRRLTRVSQIGAHIFYRA